ncbi:unnamed protein product [Peniophora sp. CBMAI 1063]|nr:unnamed protein product [Peniophora sp. CBMAI 1063]
MPRSRRSASVASRQSSDDELLLRSSVSASGDTDSVVETTDAETTDAESTDEETRRLRALFSPFRPSDSEDDIMYTNPRPASEFFHEQRLEFLVSQIPEYEHACELGGPELFIRRVYEAYIQRWPEDHRRLRQFKSDYYYRADGRRSGPCSAVCSRIKAWFMNLDI